MEESEALEVLKKKFPGVTEKQLKCMINRYCDCDEDHKMNYNDFIYFYVMVKTRYVIIPMVM